MSGRRLQRRVEVLLIHPLDRTAPPNIGIGYGHSFRDLPLMCESLSNQAVNGDLNIKPGVRIFGLPDAWVCSTCFQVPYQRREPLDINSVDTATHEQRVFAERQLDRDRATEYALRKDETSPMGCLPIVCDQFTNVAPQALSLLHANRFPYKRILVQKGLEGAVRDLFSER